MNSYTHESNVTVLGESIISSMCIKSIKKEREKKRERKEKEREKRKKKEKRERRRKRKRGKNIIDRIIDKTRHFLAQEEPGRRKF